MHNATFLQCVQSYTTTPVAIAAVHIMCPHSSAAISVIVV